MCYWPDYAQTTCKKLYGSPDMNKLSTYITWLLGNFEFTYYNEVLLYNHYTNVRINI